MCFSHSVCKDVLSDATCGMPFLVSRIFSNSRWLFLPHPVFTPALFLPGSWKTPCFSKLCITLHISRPALICVPICCSCLVKLRAPCLSSPFQTTMQPSNIVNFAVATSVSMQYFQGHPTDGRLQQFEEIAAASSALLQHIAKPPYMKSIYDLWVTVTSAMAVLERTLFPNQPIQTPTALALPQNWKPLCAVLDESLQMHAELIPMAMRNLDAFNTWFRTHFDVYLHAETTAMIDDAALLLQSVHHFLLMTVSRHFCVAAATLV